MTIIERLKEHRVELAKSTSFEEKCKIRDKFWKDLSREECKEISFYEWEEENKKYAKMDNDGSMKRVSTIDSDGHVVTYWRDLREEKDDQEKRDQCAAKNRIGVKCYCTNCVSPEYS